MSRDPELYRPCVGAVIFNASGQVWIGRRPTAREPYVWQFPQGGRDPGEDAETAIWRELWEEIGIRRDHVEMLGRTETELYYDFPPGVAARKRLKFEGQRQIWFALRLTASDEVFRFDNEDPPEFNDWQWSDFHVAVSSIVPFKRETYEAVAGRFLAFSDLQS